LPLAATKQLVADRVAVPDKAEIAILVAGDDKILSLFHHPLVVDNESEALEVARERMFGEQFIVVGLRCDIHRDALEGTLLPAINPDQ
jgi:hypothetical protein